MRSDLHVISYMMRSTSGLNAKEIESNYEMNLDDSGIVLHEPLSMSVYVILSLCVGYNDK